MFLPSENQKKPYICAIYTRISEQEKEDISPYDTIEAQRERCEKYIELFEERGWTFLKTRYDDRCCSGGTLQRPALKRLIDDAKQKKGKPEAFLLVSTN